MPDTLTIGSMSPLSILIAESIPDPAKPGEFPAPRTAVIKGMSGGLEGLTEGVDAAFYHGWLKDNPMHPALANGLFREIPDGDAAKDTAAAFGFEPGLKAVATAAPVDAAPGQGKVPTTDTSTGRTNPPNPPKA